MLSIDTIIEMGREIMEQAAEEGREPLILTATDWLVDLDRCVGGAMPERMRRIPNLGDPDYLTEHLDGQWELVETLFVDKTGWDLWDAGGPALSVGSFCKEALRLTQEHGNLGWFLGMEGQFQIHVYAARRTNG